MKRFLSIALALMLVLMPTVWAAPTMQIVESVNETVAEVETAEEMAELSAVSSITPGINVLTGTMELLDAEKNGASFSDITNVMVTNGFDSTTFGVVDNPVKSDINPSTYAYTATAAKVTADSYQWFHPSVKVSFNPAISDDRPIYTSFKAAKINTGEHTSNGSAWVLTDGSQGIVKNFSVPTNNGWNAVNQVIDYSKASDSAVNDGYINYINFQLTSADANVTRTVFYFDDIGLYPTYKITYMDVTGENVVATDYALLDENGDFLTAYSVKDLQYVGDKCYGKWSLSVGGDIVKSVPLANKDIVLYATVTSNAIESLTADKTELDCVGETVDISATLGAAMSNFVEDEFTWSVTGDSIALNTDVGGKVTATAVADGESTVTVKIDGATKSIVINVKEAFDLASDISYVTSENSANVAVEFKNDYTSAETINWTIDDVDGVATLTDNGDGTATVSSKGGSGVVTLTAALASNSAKKKNVSLYVTDTAVTDDIKLVVTPKSATITENAGVVDIDAKVFSTDANADLSVNYVSDDVSIARVIMNPDGTVKVVAVKDGTANITVTAACDSTVYETITITVSGQRQKHESYEIRYLAFGNSFLDHNRYDGWPWADDEDGNGEQRGMAASRAELDYFNRTIWHLTHGQDYYATVEGKKGGSNYWESALESYTLENAYANSLEKSKPLIDTIKSYQPNLITVQLAENVRQKDPDILALCYDAFYGAIKDAAPEECVIVAITPFWAPTDVRANAVITAAKKAGFLVNDMTFVASKGSGAANPYYAYAQYAGSPTVNAFGGHPGDYGMDEIAKGNVEQINTILASTITPDYIYIPTAFEISGSDLITTENGTAKYTVTVAPSDAVKDAEWSVDNENVATISQNGVLTAINNGTVKITAKSSYDDSVIAEKTVTISGQAPCYTVTYDAGTDDTSVEGLPEAFVYAKGDFVLSNVAPTRTGYKFTGWALVENGTPITVANITSNTTVYATWKFADSWFFEKDGDYEGIKRFGLFNEKVADGVYLGISYESQDGMYIYNDALLINSKNYTTFRFKASMSTAGTDTSYNVVITTTDGEHTYNADVSTADMTEFTFDISDLTGTITGFKITPVVFEAEIKVDEIEFVRLPGADILYVTEADTVIDAEDGTHYYGTIDISEGASVILKNGIFLVDDFTGATNAVTTVDANLITTDEIPGYVVIDLGEKADAAYKRYVQANGYTYVINEYNNQLGLAYPEETIITVTTKNIDTLIDLDFYCINNGTISALDTFNDSLKTTNGATMRADEKTGIRFRAGITTTAKSAADDYKVTEYGFIIARQDQIDNGNAQLNFDFANIAYGAAYLTNANGAVTKDNVFETTDTEIFFTGVAINIPVKNYTSVLSARPYMKIKTANGVHTVYGEVISRSIYQVARSIIADENNGLTAEELEIVQNIINSVQPDNESFVDVGGLY